MASNYTEHYGLCQWEAGDPFIRTDFNQDNQKIDAALAGHDGALEAAEQQITDHDTIFSNLAYLIFWQIAKDYDTFKELGCQQVVFVDTFDTANHVASLTGGDLRVASGLLVMNTPSTTATMTTVPIGPASASWTRVKIWLRCTPGPQYTLALNGTALPNTASWPATALNGSSCTELQFEADLSGSGPVVLTFGMTTGLGQMARVYEYGVLFL